MLRYDSEKVTKRPLFFWGIGIICNACHLGHPEIKVEGYIDSNYEEPFFNGKTVLKPDKVEIWRSIFVVITVKNNEEIKEYLLNLGLEEGIDYVDYSTFLGIEETSLIEELDRIEKKVETEGLKGRVVIFAPMFMSRVSDQLINFFKEYVSVRSKEDYLLLSQVGIVTEERAEELVGFKTINYPEEQQIRDSLCDGDRADFLISNIQEEEKAYVLDFERQIRKDHSCIEKWLYRYYGFYRQLFEILEPKKVMVWGGWRRETFYIKYIARNRNIDAVYLEHGFIPGTIQSDKEGIAGYGEIAIGNREYRNVDVDPSLEEYGKIRDWIIEGKKDNGVFRRLEGDEQQIRKLNLKNKTILLIGTGCRGWDVEEGTDFWMNYVSSEYSSRISAYTSIKNICIKNGWNFVYKPHPGEKDEFCDKDATLDSIAVVRFMEIDRLIEICDLVITISTAVSYKVLLHEKPLVEVGKSGLSGQGCSYIVRRNLEDILNIALRDGFSISHKEKSKNYILNLLKYNHWDDLTHTGFPYGRKITEDII